MRLAWLTDIHLNFLDDEAEIDRFLDNVREDAPDVVLLSGDTAEAYSIIGTLEHVQQHLQKPIYFVLGNHDYYRGAIRTVRAAVQDFAEETEWLTWLPAAGVVELTSDVALIGHGAWADGRCGNYDRSTVLMNDYLLIEEFAGLAPRARLERLHALGDEAADYFRQTLTEAVAHYKRVILVTHVPPFEAACWHEGRISDDNFLPHFVCQAAGVALVEVMNAHPACELLVLCGHTHGEGQAQITDNIHVLTGGAEYGLPEVQRVFDLVEPETAAHEKRDNAAGDPAAPEPSVSSYSGSTKTGLTMTQDLYNRAAHYAFNANITLAKTDGIRRKTLDIAYAGLSPQQKLDIYLPDEAAAPYPVIVAIHGGAFMCGDKADIQVQAMLAGLKRGYAVVSINYRMSWEAIFPALVQDGKAAVRWIRTNADQYGFDPDKIAVWGGSAGGYLCAMLGVSAGVDALDDPALGNSEQSSMVQAVVDWFGPTNFLLMDEQLTAAGLAPHPDMTHSAADSPESLILGGKLSEIPEQVQAANPITYVQANIPPFLIQHGDRDPVVPSGQSVLLAERIAAVAGPDRVTLDLLTGAGHGGPLFETPENINKVLDFLDQQLRGM